MGLGERDGLGYHLSLLYHLLYHLSLLQARLWMCDQSASMPALTLTPIQTTPDLDHLWTLFESCTITNVANMFQERLLELYHCVDYETTDDAAEFRTAFVR